eukprot:scaffold1697_cov180-Amphora_coffeaeformis.AAC.27
MSHGVNTFSMIPRFYRSGRNREDVGAKQASEPKNLGFPALTLFRSVRLGTMAVALRQKGGVGCGTGVI